MYYFPSKPTYCPPTFEIIVYQVYPAIKTEDQITANQFVSNQRLTSITLLDFGIKGKHFSPKEQNPYIYQTTLIHKIYFLFTQYHKYFFILCYV